MKHSPSAFLRWMVAILAVQLVCGTAFAQITVTNTTFPVAGDTLKMAIDNSPGIINFIFTPPGGPQSWDLSSLQVDALQNFIFRLASDGSVGGQVPAAELVMTPAPGAGEYYYNVTSNRIELAAYYGIAPYDIVSNALFTYNPPLEERQAPLNFLDFFQSSSGILEKFPPSAFTPSLLAALPVQPDSLRYRVAMNQFDAVDAYGSLSIPGGTYNVLREKRTRYTATRLDGKIQPLGWLDITDIAIQAGFQGLGVDTSVYLTFLSDVTKEAIASTRLNAGQNAAAQTLFKYIAPQTVDVTVATVPAGLQITVDASAYTSPQTFQWTPASSHTIATSSPQSGAPGTRYVFLDWSDAGSMSHTVTAPNAPMTYTATFTTQHELTTLVSPVGAGTISPPTGYYDEGNISVSASAAPGYLFAGFSDALTGTTTPQTLNLTAPDSVTANFVVDPTQRSHQLIGLQDVAQTQGVDDLIRIPDPTSGVGVLVGSLGANFTDSEALAVNPSTNNIYVVDNSRLVLLDALTGNGSLVGSIGFSDVDGIAFNPLDGRLYGVTYGSNKILTIDLVSGQGSVVASDVLVGHRLNDLAFHPDGRAFILTDGSPSVYQVDIQTGQKLAKWNVSGATSLESLLWSIDGSTLYSAGDRDGFKDLVTLALLPNELATSTFVSTSHSGFSDIEALAWLRSDIVVLMTNWDTTDAMIALPGPARLQQNQPNPFNPMTRITFELAREGAVRCDVYDVHGRHVATLLDGVRSAGQHSVTWNGRTDRGTSLPSGVYQYQLQGEGWAIARKMVLAR